MTKGERKIFHIKIGKVLIKKQKIMWRKKKMRISSKKIISLILVFTLLFSMSYSAFAAAAEGFSDVSVTFTSDKKQYKSGEEIKLKTKIENVTGQKQYVSVSYRATPFARFDDVEKYNVSYAEVENEADAEFLATAKATHSVFSTEWMQEIYDAVFGSFWSSIYLIMSMFNSRYEPITIRVDGVPAVILAEVDACLSLPEEKPDENKYYTVTFDYNYEGAPEASKQKVKDGEYATMPTIPEREGYAFVGWFTTDNSKEPFNIYSTKINSDIVLIAKWIDISDTTDTDNDGVPDTIEEYLGTDMSKDDTDGDGLSDYIEIVNLGLDPLKADSDYNGINDGDEDCDADGLTNLEEIRIGTDPSLEDTDGDMLSDKKEIELGTDPLKKDTDNDGVSDGKEIELGTDPLVAQASFDIIMSSEDNGDSVKPSVEITLDGSQVETLHVEEFNNYTFFPETMPGYMGKAYDFSVDGSFDKAIIRFEFDSATLSENAEPTIYYYNESEQELEALDTTIQGNVASAEVKHFSKYILVDRTIYEKSFSWIDVWDAEKNYTNAEIVLVIDDSGSLGGDYEYDSSKGVFTGGKDPNHLRLDVARSFIDNASSNTKIGIVKFDGLIDDISGGLIECSQTGKNELKSLLKFTYKDDSEDYNLHGVFDSRGMTNMYAGIDSALNMFSSSSENTMKVIVVFTDGEAHDTEKHTSVVNKATREGVKIYTVGLGNSTSYFNNYLKPLAVNTTGAFYLASNADQLSEIYNNISQKIDIETDSDNDGIPDYYEDNMIIFSGVKIALDKNNPDTDGDGIKDGEEVVLKYEYNNDRTKVKVTGRIITNPEKKNTFRTVANEINKNRVLTCTNMNIKEIHPLLGLTNTMMDLSTDASNMLDNVPVALDAFSFACSWLENSVSITQLNVTTSKDDTMSIKYGSSIELNLSGKKTSLSSLLVNKYYNYSPSIVFTANKKADECIRNWFGLSGNGTYSMELDFGKVYVGDYGYYLIYENGEFYQVPIIHEDTTMYVYYKEGKKVTKLFDAASILRGIRIKMSQEEKAKVLSQLKKNGFEPAHY